MIDLSDLLVFVAALMAVYLLPGPDMALVISTAAFRGPRSGLMAALGLALSRTLHVTLSALGLAALFHTHPLLFDGVRWLGAAYLMWLAWKIVRAGEGDASEPATEAHAGLAALRRGVMTNLLNPKALMFCALLLPQFISTQHDLSGQYLILGSLLVGIGFLFDMAYALAAASLARRVSGLPSRSWCSRASSALPPCAWQSAVADTGRPHRAREGRSPLPSPGLKPSGSRRSGTETWPATPTDA